MDIDTLFNLINLTSTEKLMMSTALATPTTKTKIVNARLNMQAFIRSSNVADDIAIIDGIIADNPPTQPSIGEIPTLPSEVVAQDGTIVQLSISPDKLSHKAKEHRIMVTNAILDLNNQSNFKHKYKGLPRQ